MTNTRTATNPKGAGKRSKDTPERRARILEFLRAGNTRKCSAEAAGVSPWTVIDWQNKDPEFAEQCREAEAEAESAHVAVIAKAAIAGDWRAAESWLKRRRRDDWGDHVMVDNFDPTKLTDEQLEEARRGKVRLEMVS